MSPEEQRSGIGHDGLYAKYYVERLDGQEGHEDCEYYVLDLAHDPYARIAIAAYALNCEYDHPKLAQQLRRKMLEISEQRHREDPGNYPPL